MAGYGKHTFNPEDVIQRDWRFGMHLPTGPNGEDMHLIKEVLTVKDGDGVRYVPHMRVLKDFERPIWTTKMQHRTYQDKKEYEKLEKLDKHMVRQGDLRNKVAALTGRPTSPAQLGELLCSPYIYAGDVPSTAIIHRELYQKANEGKTPVPYTYAAFDTETDVLYGTNQIIIGSMTMLPYVHLVIRQDWLEYKGEDTGERIINILHSKIDGVLADFFAAMDKDKKGDRFPPELRDLKYSYEIVDTELDIVEKSWAWFHENKPDWMGIWNIDFDASKVMDCLKRNKAAPEQYLCDPMVPYDYRKVKYKRAQTMKEAASGKGKPVSPHDQWHFMFAQASFTMVDAMSAYRLLRLGEQEERSYSLDAILDKETGGALRKLTYAPADKYVKEKWHQVMQRDHKWVYLAYAAVDTISMCLLDRLTRDLSHRLPAMADITSFDQCNSQPKRLRDAFYVFALEDHNCVIGSVGHSRDFKKPEPEPDYGDEVENGFGGDEDDFEEEEFSVLDRRNWVITLPSHMSAPGLPLLRGDASAITGIRAMVYDSDAVSSYPSCTQVANVSKITTRKEICKVGDLDERVFRNQNLNLLFGQVNAVEYTTRMFGAPTLMALLDAYDARKAAQL